MAAAQMKQRRLELLWTEDAVNAAMVKPHTRRERQLFFERGMWRPIESADGPNYRDDPRYMALQKKMRETGRFVMPSEVGL